MRKEHLFQTYNPKEDLENTRVLQQDLIYIIGLSPRIANKTVLLYKNLDIGVIPT